MNQPGNTGIPQQSPSFQTTHWSLVLRATDSSSPEASAALEQLCRIYWYPLFAYVRSRGHDLHQAEDLTQAFFVQLLEKKSLEVADCNRGRLRTFLLSSMNHFLANEWNRAQAKKRGGGFQFISLDYVMAQESAIREPFHEITPERLFEKRWAETVLNRILSRLKEEFDGADIKRYEPLKVFIIENKGESSYAEAAAKLQMSPQAVKSAVHRMRQRYQTLLREEIGHTVGSRLEVDEEIRHLIKAIA